VVAKVSYNELAEASLTFSQQQYMYVKYFKTIASSNDLMKQQLP